MKISVGCNYFIARQLDRPMQIISFRIQSKAGHRLVVLRYGTLYSDEKGYLIGKQAFALSMLKFPPPNILIADLFCCHIHCHGNGNCQFVQDSAGSVLTN